jgi:hypothetical protein
MFFPVETDQILGMDRGQFLAIVVAVPLAAIILIVAIVMLAVTKTRRILFPFRDRKRHEMQASSY